MVSKDLRTDFVTNSVDPLAAARVDLAPTEREAAGRAAFADLIGGGGYDSLSLGGKDAFIAVGRIANNDERFVSARQAALDAVRDAKTVGIFNADAKPAQPGVAESKDPAVRNQSPTGTQGESAGPSPSIAAPALPVSEPNTTTPAVKGQKP
jgi:hypothetical protein